MAEVATRPLRRWFAAALLAGCGGAVAMPIPFDERPQTYSLQEEPLPLFLQRFFADQGLAVALSPGVEQQGGTLSGPRQGTPDQIFRSIADAFGLVAYYDGATVRVYHRSERVSRFFVVPPRQTGAFLDGVRQLGLSNEFNSVRVTEETGLVAASGTPHFVDQVAQLADALGQRPDPVDTVFRFFALKHAWATDRSFVVGNRQITIPGVATILQQLLDERGGYAQPFGNEVVLPASAPSVSGQGLAAQGRFPEATRVLATDARGGLRLHAVEPPPPALASMPAGRGYARIVADPYRNAVIVRDLPERIALYEELVRALDTESPILEIEATIIDVDTDRLRRLGVEWRGATRSTEVMLGQDGAKPDFLGALTADDIAALGQVPGFQIGAIIGDENRFIARVNALQEEGAMRIVSRPQVVTLNDVEAVIESSRQLFVPVEGAYQVDLFNVYAGTVLRVTPHRIAEDAQERIRLLVTVEDGDVRLTTSNVQRVEIPEVTRNAVTTQAVIQAGQSLLLGGLIRDAANTTVTKVPLLGDLPLLGALFRSRAREASRTERLFLISPRLLDQSRPQRPLPQLQIDPRGAPLPEPPPLPPEPPLPAAPRAAATPAPVEASEPPSDAQTPALAPSPPVSAAAQDTAAEVARPTASELPGAAAQGSPDDSSRDIAREAASQAPAADEPHPLEAAPGAVARTFDAPPEPGAQRSIFVVSAAHALHVRKTPAMEAERLGTLRRGTEVTAGAPQHDAQGREWREVSALDSAGLFISGWVRNSLLRAAAAPADGPNARIHARIHAQGEDESPSGNGEQGGLAP